MTCPHCREDGETVEIIIDQVEPRGTETVITVRCPECGWTERYEL